MKWAAKPVVPMRSLILICVCGNKYIKTRDEQIVCLRCIQLEASERRDEK